MDAPAQYLEELRGELGLYPTWFPGDPIELGAFGRIVGGRFVADGQLSDLGIAVEPRHHEQKHSIKKQRGMKLQAASSTTAGSGLIDAEVGVDVEVAREYAWAFAARGMSTSEIANILEVQRAVLEARKAGDWLRGWLLVSEVRRVEHLNVLVARSKQTRFRVRAQGTLAEPLDILLQEQASFELSTDDVFAARNVKNATPLYGLRKLKGFFAPQLDAVRGYADEEVVDHGDGGQAREAEPSSLEVANDEPFFSGARTVP